MNSISFACDFSDFRNLGRCELDLQGSQILFEILKGNTLTVPGRNITGIYLDLLRTGNRDNIFALGKKPCQCDLASRCFVFLAEFLEALHELQDIREVLGAKPSRGVKIINLRLIDVNTFIHTGEWPSSSRRPRYHHEISK